MKYRVGDRWTIKKDYRQKLKKKEIVEITKVVKKGKKTFVDVKNIDGITVRFMSVKVLHKLVKG